MEAQERMEVRGMLHDILAGWQAENVAREEITNLALKNIGDHLDRLNGSVAKHEKIINENIPHTIANCPQQENIVEFRDNMITVKAVKKAIYTGIIATGTLFTIIFILYQMFK